MSSTYASILWPVNLVEDTELGWKKYHVPLSPKEKVFLEELFPDSFQTEIAQRYSFDLKNSLFRRAMFASAFAFLTNARIEYRKKSGELAKSQKLREEKLRAHDKFVELFEIKFPPDPTLENPNGISGAEILKLIVLDAIEHQDKDRAITDIYKFWDEFPILGEFIRNLGQDALFSYEELPTKGRPKAKGAFQFVATLADFWEMELARPLKLDTQNSQVITDAGKFILDCGEPINNLRKKEYEKITDSKVTSMIRRYRTEKAKQQKDLHKIEDWP